MKILIMKKIKVTLYTILVICTGITFACSSHRSTCPSYWEGSKEKASTKGTPLTTNDNGEVKMKGEENNNMQGASPVRMNNSNGLVKKKKNTQSTRSYAQSRKKR